MAVLPLVDMVLNSEVREWDSIKYIRDSILAGQKKSMVSGFPRGRRRRRNGLLRQVAAHVYFRGSGRALPDPDFALDPLVVFRAMRGREPLRSCPSCHQNLPNPSAGPSVAALDVTAF